MHPYNWNIDAPIYYVMSTLHVILLLSPPKFYIQRMQECVSKVIFILIFCLKMFLKRFIINYYFFNVLEVFYTFLSIVLLLFLKYFLYRKCFLKVFLGELLYTSNFQLRIFFKHLNFFFSKTIFMLTIFSNNIVKWIRSSIEKKNHLNYLFVHFI